VSEPTPIASATVLTYADILNVLPHRYPFLFVDGVSAFEKGVRLEAYKNVSFNDQFFSGHFPMDPVMPGVIQIEALAQAACILIALSFPEEAQETSIRWH
jgi:3-hydroxymyristoyl/3-hydroxydecanoyl-(acyl carrier protein) dehydratase